MIHDWNIFINCLYAGHEVNTTEWRTSTMKRRDSLYLCQLDNPDSEPGVPDCGCPDSSRDLVSVMCVRKSMETIPVNLPRRSVSDVVVSTPRVWSRGPSRRQPDYGSHGSLRPFLKVPQRILPLSFPGIVLFIIGCLTERRFPEYM